MAVARGRHLPPRWGSPMEASTSRYGTLAAAAAALTVLASLYLVFTGNRCPPLLLVAFYAAGAAEIVVLCRVALPGWIQGLLAMAIIASLTTLTACTDLFGVEHSAAAIPTIEKAVVDRPIGAAIPTTAKPKAGGSAGGASGASGGSGSTAGAKVIFAPSTSGDGGWAKMLNAAYDRHLGGPRASGLMISGNVGAKQIGKDMSVQVSWGVSTNGVSVHCGSTSAYGSDYPALSDQIRQGLGQAISRSLELQRPSCQ